MCISESSDEVEKLLEESPKEEPTNPEELLTKVNSLHEAMKTAAKNKLIRKEEIKRHFLITDGTGKLIEETKSA